MHIDVLNQGETPWELRRFRYEVYVNELNRRQKYANHDDQTITDPLDSFSTNIIARDGVNIAGCVRVSFCRDGDIGYYKMFYRVNHYFSSLERISIMTQLMTSKKTRRYRIGKRLAERAYEYCLINNIEYCFIDCNDPLESMFNKAGFRTLFKDKHHDYGLVNVMILNLLNIDNLRTINSHLAAVYDRVYSGRPAIL